MPKGDRPRVILARAKAMEKETGGMSSYGVHPVRCDCGFFKGHDGRRLHFKDRIKFCVVTFGEEIVNAKG